MTDHDTILVGVDGSEASFAAIRFAASEAHRHGSGIRLVHVLVDWPVTPTFPLAPSDFEDVGREILRTSTEEAHKLLAPQHVTTSLLDGPRVRALLRAAEHARLVVLGSRQRPAIERLLTGSTVVGVAARAACPVVAVPTSWSASVEHHSIVAGVKSTEYAAELVRRALEVAADRKAHLIIVHAWELPNQYEELIAVRVDEAEWEDRTKRAIEHRLTGVREVYAEVPVEIRVVHGQPARVLQHASNNADLLLLARRHHGFPFGHIGGTARALLREGHCPVEVVPPTDDPTDT